MAKLSDYIGTQELGKLGGLQVFARRVVEGFCSGLHRSPHKGFSVEFKQHRQYVAGDELRHLDWKVYGKSDRLYIREYEEETNLRCMLLLDSSGSMSYTGSTSGGLSKHAYGVRLAPSDPQIRRHIPARSRPAHLKGIIDELADAKVGGETELARVFHDLVPKIHRRSLLVIISDCFGDVPELLKALAHFRHQHHDIVIFQLWDRDELEFPFKQWTRFDSLEQAGHRLMVDPAHLRRAYMENLQRYREELKSGCYRHKIDLVPMTTDQPFADALGAFLATRRKA